MKSNKAAGTKPELMLRRALKKSGIAGASWNPKELPGRPDVFFKKEHLAVFVNGCYWHRCPYCKLPMPKQNRRYWRLKFAANVQRDKRKKLVLRKSGIKALVIWECRLQADLEGAIARVRARLEHR